LFGALLRPQGFGVRLSSAAFRLLMKKIGNDWKLSGPAE
jgi:hypothetical protein